MIPFEPALGGVQADYLDGRSTAACDSSTQKAVALMEYLIRTTNEGETVLDNTMGSGTTGRSMRRTNRAFIGIEIDERHFEIARKHVEDEQARLALNPELLPEAA